MNSDGTVRMSMVDRHVETRTLARSCAMMVYAAMMAACGMTAEGDTPCPDGFYRDGTNCLPSGGGGGGGGGEDAGGGGGGEVDAGGGDEDAGGEVDAGGPVEAIFPFAVDEVGFAPTGFFGDGETPGGIVMLPECPSRPEGARGVCHDITWKTGVGAAGFAGVFWQYPSNNWGELPGLDLPAGATTITFKAWGAQGGEVVKFVAGISEDVDGFNRETGEITLTTEPTEYSIDVRCIEYTDVSGAFGWSAGGATQDVQFYVDDITWRDDGDTSVCEGGGEPLALPFAIDAQGWVPSGYFGDVGGIAHDDQCMGRDPGATGVCHHASWSPTASSPGFAGVFWQFPENNWGDFPGQPIAPGATTVRFQAWSDAGGEVITFGAGISEDVDGFNRSTGEITLTNAPTEYTVDLSGVTYTDVSGAFFWSTANAGGIDFYIDDIRWE
jgi:hypothetical protein